MPSSRAPREAETLTNVDADSDDHVQGGLIVEHYRIDASRRLLGALLIGSLIMTVGSLAIGGGFRQDAMARLVDALDASSQAAECRVARDRYLAEYPEGRHAARLRYACP